MNSIKKTILWNIFFLLTFPISFYSGMAIWCKGLNSCLTFIFGLALASMLYCFLYFVLNGIAYRKYKQPLNLILAICWLMFFLFITGYMIFIMVT